mgnify:FL=1|tara:strand:- start:705 stop:1526 length:822 start_codon:yes stop_codon:yes gene_type:complete
MSLSTARDQFGKTASTIVANKVMEPVMNMVGEALGSYFGQRSHGPLGPSPRYKEEKIGTGGITGDVEGSSVRRTQVDATGLGGAFRDFTYDLLTERGPERDTPYQRGMPGRRGAPDAYYTRQTPKGETKYQGVFTKNSDNPFLQGLYDNAETAASLAGYAGPIAGVAAAGLGIHFATKPRSAYALGLDGLGPSTGNSNIDAARASAHYQQETAKMKFEQQMALQQARAEAQTPGRQSYGKAIGAGMSNMTGDAARDAYSMATSIIGAQTPVYG